MSSPVSPHFDQFFQRIDLDREESRAALARAKDVSALLSRGRDRPKPVITGSIIRSTAVRQFSDVDIIFPVGEKRDLAQISPQVALANIERDLNGNRLPAAISGNAVTVHFDDGLDVDVLPALNAGYNAPGDPIFIIPSADRRSWQQYSPERQNERVRLATESAGMNLLRLIRLAKWWSRAHGNVIPSYEIEMIACAEFSEEILDLPRAVARFFIAASKSPKFTPQEHSEIKVAGNLAMSAIDALEGGDELRSIEYWRCLLGDKFPAIAR